MIYLFADNELDDEAHELRHAGQPVHVEPQVFGVLLHLLQERHRVVSKIELMDAVWPDRFVGESAVTSRIRDARRAVGDTGKDQAVIRTVHGHGYRLVADVVERGQVAPDVAPGPAVVPPRSERPAPVGRAAELDRLHAELDAALEGRRRLVFVSGAAGIGKSVLVDAFLEGVECSDGVRVARATCIEPRGPTEAYLPIFDVLGELIGGDGGDAVVDALRRFAPLWLRQMPALVTAADADEIERRVFGATALRMQREIADVLEHLARDGAALVVVLEDLHWADHATLSLLDWMARRAASGSARLLVVGTLRPGWSDDGAGQVNDLVAELTLAGRASALELAPLDEAAVRRLVEEQLSWPGVPDEVAGELHARSSGVPLVARELLRSWLDEGAIARNGGGWTADLVRARSVPAPSGVQQLVSREVARLAPEDRDVLEVGSVAGFRFTAAAVAAGLDAPEEEVERRAAGLARRGLLEVEGGGRGAETAGASPSAAFRFIHQLQQEVLYEGVLPGRRSRLHLTQARWLEADSGSGPDCHAAELASHYARGGDDAGAARYLLVAGEQAVDRSADRDAVEILLQAAEAVERMDAGPERARLELNIRLSLGAALIRTQGWAVDEVESSYRRALALCDELGDCQERFLAVWGLASVQELRGHYPESEALMEAYVDESPTATPPETCELLACSNFHQGHYARALEYAETGLDRYRIDYHSLLTTRYGEDPGVNCGAWAAVSLWLMGRSDAAFAHLHHAVELAAHRTYSISTARTMGAILHQLRGDAAAAADWARLAVDVADDHGFSFRSAQARMIRGWAAGVAGDPAAGLAELEAGLAAYESTGAAMGRPHYIGLRAELLLQSGRPDDAVAELEYALAQVPPGRTFFFEPELHRLLGLALAARSGDDLAPALAELDEAEAVARAQGSPVLARRALIDRLGLEDGAARSTAAARLAALLAELPPDPSDPDARRARELLG
jgi:DNA-binding winged helix-turn-helix (wHTH) protein/tetratricopeptide (TPR) repeat protein